MPLGIALFVFWLVMLLRFPRVMLPFSGILLALILLLAAAVGVQQWFNSRLIDQLEFSVLYQPEQCTFGKPLQISIANRTERTAKTVSWQLLANQPGHSANLLDVSVRSDEYQTDRTIQAGESWQGCFAVPSLRRGYRAAELRFSADRIQAEFQ